MNSYTIIVLAVILVINVYGFTLVAVDKNRAIKRKWRIPEQRIFLICWLGATVGVYLGLLIFHHKTRRTKFMLGIPLIFIFEILCVVVGLYLYYSKSLI